MRLGATVFFEARDGLTLLAGVLEVLVAVLPDGFAAALLAGLLDTVFLLAVLLAGLAGALVTALRAMSVEVFAAFPAPSLVLRVGCGAAGLLEALTAGFVVGLGAGVFVVFAGTLGLATTGAAVTAFLLAAFVVVFEAVPDWLEAFAVERVGAGCVPRAVGVSSTAGLAGFGVAGFGVADFSAVGFAAVGFAAAGLRAAFDGSGVFAGAIVLT